MKVFSQLEKQISAFEVMSQPLEDIKFGEDFFESLSKELAIPKLPQKFIKDFEQKRGIFPIKFLRELCKKMRKRSQSTENEQTLLHNISLFLKQFQFATSLKKYFDKNVYSSVYTACFDPYELIMIPLNDEEISGKFFLTEISPSTNLKELLEIDYKKRIIKICKELSNLNFRWNQILEEENVKIEYFEEETKTQYKLNETGFDLFAIIFLDLNLKMKKSISLLREWINQCGKCSYCKNGISDKKSSQKIFEIKKANEKLTDELKTLKNVINHIKIENQSLIEKERKLLNSIKKREDFFEVRDKVIKDYESLLARRSDHIRELNYSITGTNKYEKISREIVCLEENIHEKFSELKNLNFSVLLMNKDESELSTSLKDFIRWSDTSQQMIEDKEKELKSKMKEKEKFELILKNVYENLQRLNLVVGSNMGDFSIFLDSGSEGSYRPLTSDTYSLAESNVRFIDMDRK